MTWSTLEAEYEGFPLLLRRPDYINIWKFRKQFPELIAIEHILDEVAKNGLPKKGYNTKLADFDATMCSLLEDTKNGLIFLIETFGGKRTYYYYTKPDFDIDILVKKLKRKYKVKLESSSQTDKRWNFLINYPIEIFPK